MCSLFAGPSKIPAADQQAGPVLTSDKGRTKLLGWGQSELFDCLLAELWRTNSITAHSLQRQRT